MRKHLLDYIPYDFYAGHYDYTTFLRRIVVTKRHPASVPSNDSPLVLHRAVARRRITSLNHKHLDADIMCNDVSSHQIVFINSSTEYGLVSLPSRTQQCKYSRVTQAGLGPVSAPSLRGRRSLRFPVAAPMYAARALYTWSA